MHFETRESAGEILAGKLDEYDRDLMYVVALGPTSVPVANTIATQLDCEIGLFISSEIELPGQGDEVIGSLNQGGQFVYNTELSYADRQELGAEFRNHIEGKKLEKAHYMNRIIHNNAVVDPHQLYDRIVVFVSDGLNNGVVVESAYTLLKPIRLRKLIAAVPIASVRAIDRLHIRVDQIECLRVVDEIESLERFYDKNIELNLSQAMELINKSRT